MRIFPGRPYPLGATWDGLGVNFALFSEHAERVVLCLFDSANASAESTRIPMSEQTDMVWHVYISGIQPGQLYGYRVYGPYDPPRGHRFNPNKVMLDPYAKAIGRSLRWNEEDYGYILQSRDDLVFDDRDNAASAALAAVIDPAFTWGDDRPPSIPWNETIIYEMHVRGFSKLNQDVREPLRGTYLALTSGATLQYLKSLGITAVELMPVHSFVDEHPLVDRGLSNYWGYNTLGYFAPELRYSASQTPAASVQEFKMMVRALHAAGIEVILDVVYNHTAEGNHLGPTLSLRGIDNFSYYRLSADNQRYYMDFTGCGNTLNMRHPRVLQLIMDSLRYWITEMHVDGFRFDLASALARELFDVDQLAAFFDIIHQDPVISQVKLIAEPWDVGNGGYQVGNFPVLWTEWNGKYRDTVRRFWKGDGGVVSEFATRFSGSSDLYEQSGRRPYASINFITAHDGFTLNDLVSYNEKHNEANGEENRDGESNNNSWNCGIEGPTEDPNVLQMREQQKQNFLATLLLSQGVPMIRSGDEISHTSFGNNNTYCQDNEMSWLNWQLDDRKKALLDFTTGLIRLRKRNPVLHRPKFFQGRRLRGSDVKDITWLRSDGQEMTDQEWNEERFRFLGVLLSGDAADLINARGEAVRGDTLLFLFNAQSDVIHFPLPDMIPVWEVLVNTVNGQRRQRISAKEPAAVQPHTSVVLAGLIPD